jgi:phage gp36-like protein
MGYCSREDITQMIPQAELAELTAESGDNPDYLVVDEAIGKADAEIDSYLGVKYVVPLTPVPAQVKALSVDLAIYHLYSRRSVVPTARRQKYEAAVSFLQQAAAGQIVVEGVRGESPSLTREVTDLTSDVRVFTRNTLGDW